MIEKIYQLGITKYPILYGATLRFELWLQVASYYMNHVGLQYVWHGPRTVHDEPVNEIPLLILVYEFGRWPFK